MISSAEYNGPDRRMSQRRHSSADRRDMIRFQPDVGPRRSGNDRRKILNDQWQHRDT